MDFDYKTKSWCDEEGQFHGLIKFSNVSDKIRGKGKLGEFAGWIISSELWTELELNAKRIYLPGSDENDAGDGTIEVFSVEDYTSILTALEEARSWERPRKADDDYMEDAKKAYTSMIASADKLIQKLHRVIAVGKEEMESLSCVRNPVDKSFVFKRWFCQVLLEALPIYGGETCAFCNHQKRVTKDSKEGPCVSCFFSAKRLDGMTCTNHTSDWAHLRSLALQLRNEIDSVYSPLDK